MLKRLLDPDNPIMQMITKITFSAYLHLLWLLCSLPIFTIGASTTALYYVCLKMANNQEGSLTRDFFHSFKANFRQATKIWLVMLGVGIVLGIDGYVLYHLRFENIFWTLCTAIFFLVLAAYFMVFLYIFPLLSRFHNSSLAMFKNSLMIGMRFLLCTALLAFIHISLAIVIIRFFTPAIVFGMGLCALLCSYPLSPILAMCEEKAPNREELPESCQTEEE